jgi:hypothetical protein
MLQWILSLSPATTAPTMLLNGSAALSDLGPIGKDVVVLRLGLEHPQRAYPHSCRKKRAECRSYLAHLAAQTEAQSLEQSTRAIDSLEAPSRIEIRVD